MLKFGQTLMAKMRLACSQRFISDAPNMEDDYFYEVGTAV
jgi:hypothetical protein